MMRKCRKAVQGEKEKILNNDWGGGQRRRGKGGGLLDLCPREIDIKKEYEDS